VDDELVRANRLRSAAFGFYVMIVLQGVIWIVSLAYPLPGSVAAQASILAGVLAMVGAFLVLDRE
jgi:hypothetical protein